MSELTDLLWRMDTETAKIESDFKFEGKHKTLDDFADALSLLNEADEMLDGKIKDFEFDVICGYYSALASRMIETSTEYDEEKFERAKEILERAKVISLDGGYNLRKTRLKTKRKIAKLTKSLKEEISGYTGTKTDAFVHYSRCLHLLFDVGKYYSRIMYIREEKRLKPLDDALKLTKSVVLGAYELARGGATILGLVYTGMGLSGSSGHMFMGVSIIGGLALTRYMTNRIRTNHFLGYERKMPKV